MITIKDKPEKIILLKNCLEEKAYRVINSFNHSIISNGNIIIAHHNAHVLNFDKSYYNLTLKLNCYYQSDYSYGNIEVEEVDLEIIVKSQG